MNVNKTIENLKARGFAVSYFETAEKCCEYMNKEINGVTVGAGGSMTLAELGLLSSLEQHNTVYTHSNPKMLEKHTAAELRALAATADVYLSSANAVSENGEVVNIDGNGNRIASTAFGHERVYIIIGVNKIAPDLEKALLRAHNIAAPLNAKRLKRNTPCAVNGDKCYNCNSPERICRGTLIFERPMSGQKTEIVIVNQALGF